MRGMLLAGLAMVLIVLSIGMTLGQVDKGDALRWPIPFPRGSRLVAGLSTSLTEQTTPAQLASAANVAQGTLAREPASLPALQALGLVQSLQGRPQAAKRTFDYAESLSRRDTGTELWLIEYQVALGDIPGALIHYDRAMRTSAANRTLLVPVLAAAANDPAIAGPLARVLAQRPNWWFDYMNRAAAVARSPATLYRAARALALRPDHDDERLVLASVIARLLTLQAPDAAARLYGEARRTGPVNMAAVRDGGFEREPMLPPIDWSFTDDGSAAATRTPRGNGYALDLYGSAGGVRAYQILALRPGRYRVSLSVGNVSGAVSLRPRVEARCLEGAVLGSAALADASGDGRAMAFMVDVPGGCGLQVLALLGGTDEAVAADAAPWVDDVRVDRVLAGER